MDRRLLRFRSLGNTFPCRGRVGGQPALGGWGLMQETPRLLRTAPCAEGWGTGVGGGRREPSPYLPSPRGTFPCWVQSGGSSCPRGRRPFSRQDRKDSRWPPCGKCSGGLWMPSWLTSTSVPPLSGGKRAPVRLGRGLGARATQLRGRRAGGCFLLPEPLWATENPRRRRERPSLQTLSVPGVRLGMRPGRPEPRLSSFSSVSVTAVFLA